MCVVIQVTVIYLLHGESISSANKNYNFQFNIIKKLSLIGTLIFYYFHTYLVCVRVRTRATVHMWKSGGQLVRTSYLFLSCGSWGPNTDPQIHWHQPFHAEPSRQPCFTISMCQR